MGDLSEYQSIENGQIVVRPFSAYNLKRNDTVLATNNAPYLFRKSLSVPNASPYALEKLVGGSIAWNQMVVNGLPSSADEWTVNRGTLSYANNVITVTADGTGLATAWTSLSKGVPNHKFIVSMDVKLSNVTNELRASLSSSGINTNAFLNETLPSANTWHTIRKIALPTDDSITRIRIAIALKNGETMQLRNVMVMDLTLMFGSVIADYVYSLESSQAGAGIAWLKSYGYLQKPYYAYNAGGIESVCAGSKVVTGKNLLDESTMSMYGLSTLTGDVDSNTSRMHTDYIPIIPTESYYLYAKNYVGMFAWFYDSEKNYIGYHGTTLRNTTFIPQNLTNVLSGGASFANARYVRFRYDSDTSDTNEICLSFGTTATDYEPYHKTTILLGGDILRGVQKIDGNGNMYYDGDIKNPDGSIDRKYGIVDLGTLDWLYTNNRFQAGISDSYRVSSSSVKANIICPKYVTVYADDIVSSHIGIAHYTNSNVWVYDPAYTNAATFKTAMNGVYLVYELATPTTEQSTPFVDPQLLFDGGTEKFVDYGIEQQTRDVAIPVGHETSYMGSATNKSFYLPSFPDLDGVFYLEATVEEGELLGVRWTDMLQTYSTEETKIGTWIDGKTVYRRVVVLPSSVTVPNNTWTTIYTNAFIGEISQIITANYVNTSNGGSYNFFYMKPSGNDLQYYFPGSGNLSLGAGVAFVITYIKS